MRQECANEISCQSSTEVKVKGLHNEEADSDLSDLIGRWQKMCISFDKIVRYRSQENNFMWKQLYNCISNKACELQKITISCFKMRRYAQSSVFKINR